MSQINSSVRKIVAVFFGGRSPEHDVSVVSGLQALSAIDTARYEAFPVYIAPDGAWYVGDVLRQRSSYLLDQAALAQVQEVSLDLSAKGGRLMPKKTGMFGAPKPIVFDIALPVFHGLFGEDGNLQGVFEIANVPYAGMRTKASAILMDKVATKHFLRSLEIPVLPHAVLRRPREGYFIPEGELAQILAPVGFPCVIKPAHLGSSIGVAKVNSVAEAKACLPSVFELDSVAIAEPYVENLVEYNIAIRRHDGRGETSAIERPKSSAELLDFKQKYLSGGGAKKLGGVKNPQASEGMLSLTREINPALEPEMAAKIRQWAVRMYDALDGTGAPRIDYISNAKTGQIWMNEVNPCPGSLGYFLWEAAEKPVLFTDLLTMLLEEAVAENTKTRLPRDPVPVGARLLRRAN